MAAEKHTVLDGQQQEQAVTELRKLPPETRQDVSGVLGNHDRVYEETEQMAESLS